MSKISKTSEISKMSRTLT